MININDKIRANSVCESQEVNEGRKESFRIRYGGRRCHWDNGNEIPVVCDPKDIDTIAIAIYYGLGNDAGWCGYYDGNGEYHTIADCM